MGANFILSGVVGSIIVGKLLDRTKQFLLFLRIICTMSVVFMTTAVWTLPSESTVLLNINLTLLGLFLIPIIPVGFNLSVELTKKD